MQQAEQHACSETVLMSLQVPAPVHQTTILTETLRVPQGLEKLEETLESDVPLPLSDTDAESREFAVAMAGVALDTKGGEPVVLHVAPFVSWTSYLVIVTVSSRPQLTAILTKAKEAAQAKFGRRPSGPQAARQASLC